MIINVSDIPGRTELIYYCNDILHKINIEKKKKQQQLILSIILAPENLRFSWGPPNLVNTLKATNLHQSQFYLAYS